MKRYILIIAMAVCCATSYAQPAEEGGTITFSALEIEQNGDMVDISFNVEVGETGIDKKYMLVITPQLTGVSTGLARLPEIMVRGELAAKKYAKHGNDRAMGYAVVRHRALNLENGTSAGYSVSIPYGKWMEECSLVLKGVLRSKAYAAETEVGVLEQGLNITHIIKLVYKD